MTAFIDLEPIWHPSQTQTAEKYLEFYCPTCPRGATRYSSCIINLPIGSRADMGWQITTEDLATISVSPSILHHCKTEPHFFITDGQIVMA